MAEETKFSAADNFGGNFISGLIQQVGPVLTDALLKWLEAKMSALPTFLADHAEEKFGTVFIPGVKNDLGVEFGRKLLASLLQQHKDEVVAFLTSEVGSLYDQAVNLIAGTVA